MSVLMEFTSHIAGKNAMVFVYPDRIVQLRADCSQAVSARVAPRR